jgi:hypothetical protein
VWSLVGFGLWGVGCGDQGEGIEVLGYRGFGGTIEGNLTEILTPQPSTPTPHPPTPSPLTPHPSPLTPPHLRAALMLKREV